MSDAPNVTETVTMPTANADNQPEDGERRHDPLCPPTWRWEDDQPCMFCALIARVREVERAAALRDAVQAVKAAMPDEDEGWEKSIAVAWMRHAVAAIEALGGER